MPLRLFYEQSAPISPSWIYVAAASRFLFQVRRLNDLKPGRDPIFEILIHFADHIDYLPLIELDKVMSSDRLYPIHALSWQLKSLCLELDFVFSLTSVTKSLHLTIVILQKNKKGKTMTGQRIAYIRVSTAEQNTDSQKALLAQYNIDKPFEEKVSGKKCPVEYSERRAGDPAKLYAANEKAKKILGWKPEYTNIEEIIRTAWNWELNKRF